MRNFIATQIERLADHIDTCTIDLPTLGKTKQSCDQYRAYVDWDGSQFDLSHKLWSFAQTVRG